MATGDTNGFWTGATTINIAGQAILPKATVSGQAILNPDCTGTITYNKGTASEVNINFVVNPRTGETLGLTTDKGSVTSCELKRMSNGRAQDKWLWIHHRGCQPSPLQRAASQVKPAQKSSAAILSRWRLIQSQRS